MEAFLTDPIVLMFGCWLLGIAVGVIFTRSTASARIEKERKAALKKFEAEKREISDELTEELANIRASLIDTVHSYKKAVEVVQTKLPPAAGTLSAPGGESIARLELDLKEAVQEQSKPSQSDKPAENQAGADKTDESAPQASPTVKEFSSCSVPVNGESASAKM